jgi:hypothetical protein
VHSGAQLAKTIGTVEQTALSCVQPGFLRATLAEFSESTKARPRQLDRSAVGAAVSRPDVPPSEIGFGQLVHARVSGDAFPRSVADGVRELARPTVVGGGSEHFCSPS